MSDDLRARAKTLLSDPGAAREWTWPAISRLVNELVAELDRVTAELAEAEAEIERYQSGAFDG